ncbi:MAG: aldo/keto reductase, partial [Rubrivivax sp.]
AAGVVAACDASRRRLGLDVIDLYLLHWRGGVPLAQTLAGFERLLARGHVRRVGVSNFDVDDLDEWTALTGGTRCDANQVWYSLGERGPEHALIPWQRRHGVPLMAYCPLDQGTLARHAALRVVGERHGVAAATVALAWLLGQPGVIVIPKAVQPQHLDDVLAAPRLRLDDEDHAALARAFPAPTRRRPLAMR